MIGFEKFSAGNELWNFEGMSDEKIDEISEEVDNMESTGERIVSNVKGDIKIAVPQRTTSYDEWIKSTEAEFNALLEDPGMKSSTETIFAKATLEKQAELYQKAILAKQRVIKRGIEIIWKSCLTAWGFDYQKTEARLNFGSQLIPEYKVDDILSAFEKQLISKKEARQMLKESRWKLEGESDEG